MKKMPYHKNLHSYVIYDNKRISLRLANSNSKAMLILGYKYDLMRNMDYTKESNICLFCLRYFEDVASSEFRAVTLIK